MSRNRLIYRSILKLFSAIVLGTIVSACAIAPTNLFTPTAVFTAPIFSTPVPVNIVSGQVQLTQEEQAFLAHLGTLQVLVDDNFPPITYYDVQSKAFGGVGVEVLHILSNLLQFKYLIIRDETLPWAERLNKVKRNEIHLLAGASRNASREEYGVFTTHEYFTVNYALIKAIDNQNVYVTSLNDLKNYRVGLSEGAALNDFILKFATNPAKITYYPTKEKAFEALRRQEIDLYPFNEAVFKEEFFGGKLFDFEVAFSIKEQTTKYAFFAPKTDTGARLIAILDKGMAQIRVDQVITQRYQNKSSFALYKSHLEDLQRTNDLKTIILTLVSASFAFSLMAVIVIAVWNRRLHAEILRRIQAEEISRQLNLKLQGLAMTDQLTNLFNRRAFFERGLEELERSKRYGQPLSFMMIDVDFFKKINDTYGHDVGDQTLCATAETLAKNIREVDMLARLGGEEFLVMMPNTDLVNARILADRLCFSVANTPYVLNGFEVRITVSIGVASMEESTQDVNALIKVADIAMYKAKNQGRNQVISLAS